MLLEAMYETPYYWMIDDENYNGEFSKNRGAFAEDFCEKVIGKVFGEENVYKNIEIYKGKKRLGEIDILVVWGEIILIVEIKSKRLSLKAKQGDVEYIENDFNLSVRKAYEQLVKCSSILINDNIELKYKNKFLELKNKIKKIYPICLISESYPSLNFQVKDFLKKVEFDRIEKPYVIDVFFLDVLCEYLDKPLLLVNFINRRMKYDEILNSSDEYSVLGHHLEKNLYFKNENALYFLGEESSLNLGVDFIQRRENLNYVLKNFNLLNLHTEGFLGTIVNEKKLEISLELFNFFESLFIVSEKTWKDINFAIAEIFRKFDIDGDFHSAALSIPLEKIGFTFCIDQDGLFTTHTKLRKIIKSRKYISKADKWFGVVLKRNKPYFKDIIVEKEAWLFDPYLDNLKQMMAPRVGRNELCPCGSNKKFKRCCL